jgi:fatty acid amide hydrolase
VGTHSIVFNALDLPAGVVPVTRVRPDETTRSAGIDALERRASKVDAQSRGLPVGVQIVARPWQDAFVLSVMRAVESRVSRDDLFPRTPVSLS